MILSSQMSEIEKFIEHLQLDGIPLAHLSTRPEDLQKYGRDWSTQNPSHPCCILFPDSIEEIQKMVLGARKYKIPLVPSGGRTGLSGGALAPNGEAIVSLERMNKILEFNPIDATLCCQAGVITQEIQIFAEAQGLCYPVDFAAKGSSQIGGNVATNAGGIKVVRYGLTRNWVAGLRVVTGTGELLELNRSLVKDATGYDLKHLFLGSEGTLGIIAEVTLQLTSLPKSVETLLLGVSDLECIMKLFRLFRNETRLMAFEFFTDLALHLVRKHNGLPDPLPSPCPYYLVVETEGSPRERILSLFEKAMESGWLIDGVISENAAQTRDLWRLREEIGEAIIPKEPYKNDVSVKISRVPDLLREVDTLIRRDYPDFQVVWFGHVGDGNLHINVMKPEALTSSEFQKRCEHVNEKLFQVVEKMGGSISAEHGVGITKRAYLHHTRSQSEIDSMKKIKDVFDPDHILNPGKIFINNKSF